MLKSGPGWPRRRPRRRSLRAPTILASASSSPTRADPKLAPVVAAYEKDATKPGRTFGKNGLKTKAGKLFALFTQETLVVKLPNERVDALVEEGIGKPFDPGHGRLMKEWLTVTSAKPSWSELAKEAFEFVSGRRGT